MITEFLKLIGKVFVIAITCFVFIGLMLTGGIFLNKYALQFGEDIYTLIIVVYVTGCIITIISGFIYIMNKMD